MAMPVLYDSTWTPTMRTMLERFLGTGLNGGWQGDSTDEGTLPVDIVQTPDALIVKAAVPGFTADQIDVQVEKGILSIKADAGTQQFDEGGRYYRREIHWGSLSRRIALPGVVDDTRVEAELQNGVLTLRVPVAEAAKPRHVEIKAA